MALLALSSSPLKRCLIIYIYLPPAGQSISKKDFIEVVTENLKVFWKQALIKSEKDLLETLCVGICEKLIKNEGRFWVELQQLQESNTDDHFKDWLVTLLIIQRKRSKKLQKKFGKVSKSYLRKLVSERCNEDLDLFTFPSDLLNYCENFCPNVVNIANLVILNSQLAESN